VKVTFVIADYSRVAGGMRVIAEHARRLRRRGHDVVVVATPGGRPSPVSRLFGALFTQLLWAVITYFIAWGALRSREKQ
jgi:hypothetical protein